MSDQNTPKPDPDASNPTRIPVKFEHGCKKTHGNLCACIGLTIFVFALQYLSQYLSANHYDWPYLLGAKVNELILAGQVWRLFTPMLLHGSILHIGFNMYALFVIGPR